MFNGIVNVCKEPGHTSFDVVAQMRGIFKQKKIGHTGTLDPDATGVLPVCLGSATKVCELLTDRDKTYRAVMQLGLTTDTLDLSGEVLSTGDFSGVTEAQIRSAVENYVGDILQIPPMYSALKVNGKKLCDLARKGISVERKPRPVTIHEITVDAIELPFVTITVSCSKGTYIRTLCDDIGRDLGCGAALKQLTRTRAAGYRIEDAYTLQELSDMAKAGTLGEAVTNVDQVFAAYPAFQTNTEGDFKLYNGNPLLADDVKPCNADASCDTRPNAELLTRIRVYDSQGEFCGLYGYSVEKKSFRVVKMFLNQE